MNNTKTNEVFGSRIALIFAVIGSAVGVGNFLRFPTLFAQYGGFFLVPYFVFFFLLGLPGLYIEWNLGLLAKRINCHSLVTLLEISFPKYKNVKYVGVLIVFIMFLATGYYLFIESWMLGYSFLSLGSVLDKLTPEQLSDFYNNYVQFRGSEIVVIIGIFALFVVFVLNFIFSKIGIKNGLGKFMEWAVPLIGILSLIMIVKLIFTPHFLDGVKYMFRGTPHDLLNINMWAAAAGQIFFSLSIGMGLSFVYTSFAPNNVDIVKGATVSASANSFAEVVLASFIVIPISFISFGNNIIEVLNQSSIGFGMITVPAIFGNMNFSVLLCFLWYFLLFLACLSTTLSQNQLAVVFFSERLKISKLSAIIITFIIHICFITFCIIDIKTIDLLDFIISYISTPLSSVVILVTAIGFKKIFWQSFYNNSTGYLKLAKLLILIFPIVIIGVLFLMLYKINAVILSDLKLSYVLVRVFNILVLLFLLWVAHKNVFTKEDFPEKENEIKE